MTKKDIAFCPKMQYIGRTQRIIYLNYYIMGNFHIKYETGYCFGGTQFHSFNSFGEAFRESSKMGLNYMVSIITNLRTGNEKKVFLCWDNVKILTYQQLLDLLEDPEDIRIFRQRKNKNGIFVFNGKENEAVYPRSIMSGVHFNRVQKIIEPKLSLLKKKYPL